MNRLLLIFPALLLFIYLATPDILGLHDDEMVLRTPNKTFDARLPTSTCKPESTGFVDAAMKDFSRAASTTRAQLQAHGVFVSCSSIRPWATSTESSYPWGYFVTPSNNLGDIGTITQDEFNAVLSSQLETPLATFNIEQKEDYSQRLHTAIASYLLLLGKDPDGRAGVLGEVLPGTQRFGSRYNKRTALLWSAGDRSINQSTQRIYVIVSISVINQQLVSVVLLGSTGTSADGATADAVMKQHVTHVFEAASRLRGS